MQLTSRSFSAPHKNEYLERKYKRLKNLEGNFKWGPELDAKLLREVYRKRERPVVTTPLTGLLHEGLPLLPPKKNVTSSRSERKEGEAIDSYKKRAAPSFTLLTSPIYFRRALREECLDYITIYFSDQGTVTTPIFMHLKECQTKLEKM